MRHDFLTQPTSGGYELQEFVEMVCGDPTLDHLDFAAAWVKRAGVLGLQPTLDDFRRRGGRVRGIVGIDLGGSSRQGLLLGKEACDELYVFHDPRRVFHPKVYAAYGRKRAVTLVGSNNLTFGGLTRNYEAAVKSDLDLAVQADIEYFEAIRAFFAGLVDETEVCIKADDVFLAALLTNRRYPLLDEEGDADDVEDAEGFRGSQLPLRDDAEEELFGSAQRSLRAPRRPLVPPRPPRGRRPTRTGRPARRRPTQVTADPVVKRWFKKLEAADAQQLAGSSPSNTLTLTKGDRDRTFDASTYFRDDFFAQETWISTHTRGRAQPREVARITCEVVVDGKGLGEYAFDVRHTPGYESDQHNRTTELAWRGFGVYLRAKDLRGRLVSLEKRRSGAYRLTIAEMAPGPHIE